MGVSIKPATATPIAFSQNSADTVTLTEQLVHNGTTDKLTVDFLNFTDALTNQLIGVQSPADTLSLTESLATVGPITTVSDTPRRPPVNARPPVTDRPPVTSRPPV